MRLSGRKPTVRCIVRFVTLRTEHEFTNRGIGWGVDVSRHLPALSMGLVRPKRPDRKEFMQTFRIEISVGDDEFFPL